MEASGVIAGIVFSLHGWEVVPIRADYEITLVDSSFSEDFVFSRTWPLLFERAVAGANSEERKQLIALVGEIHDSVAQGKSPKITREIDINSEEETTIASIETVLMASNDSLRLAIDSPTLAPGLWPMAALLFLLPWTYGKALTTLPSNTANQLGFFFAYALRKWQSIGFPTPETGDTWDFSDLQKMDYEFAQWDPTWRPSGKYTE